MLKKPPTVSVIIPCRNEAEHIETCIYSILAQDEPDGGFEVIVADGMSDDGTQEIIRHLAIKDSRLHFVNNPLRITPSAMNIGIKVSKGQYIAIMGAHNLYAPDYIIRAVEVLKETSADNVGGAMYCEADGYIQQAIAVVFHSPLSVGGASWHNPDYEGPADTVFGGVYRREIFDRIGYFDEELVRNQDDEFNLRLIRAGGKIWQSPKIKSWYKPRDSLSALFKQYRQYGYWKVRVIQKHKLPASIRHVIPGAFVLYLLLSLVIMPLLYIFNVAVDNQTMLMFQDVTAIIFILTVGLYVSLVLFASIWTAIMSSWKYFPILPFVFACYHFGYGIGFVEGITDFVVLKRFPDKSKTKITR